MSEIQGKLVYLTKHVTNLNDILLHLEQEGICSRDECEEIKNENIASQKNYKMLALMDKKDWDSVRNLFLEILRKTNNEHCASVVTGGIPCRQRNSILHPNVLKWWPDNKLLIKSLHKRMIGSRLLVEELHDRILEDENRMVVITESVDASKYSGMGGVGKTLTAKWYAHHYQKYYNHILWIDCGEERLDESFKSLARDLKVEDRNELGKVEEFARKCFESLLAFKCLWIYDNAESYQKEDGIFNVLPKGQENFSCLITSRSREWGVKNVGYGKITDLQLDIFSEQESLEFLKSKLDKEIEYQDHHLKELCLLLGNLPLALQLALSALNSQKIDLKSYVDKTSSKDLEYIVDEKFDAYEKTINKNIKISLDLIMKEKNGKSAYEMLMIFGYIRPNDVQSKFLLRILNCKLEVLEEAIDLLEKYSFVSKTGKVTEFPNEGVLNKLFGRDKIEVEMYCLSIHRLLQQVIRHNERKMERKTLRKILGCKGFAEYKLIPFTKYADEELRKKFPKVKAELLDQWNLKKIVIKKRFEDSAQLAKFIHEELKTKTTKFNYAICLDKNGQVEECVNNLEELFVKRKTNENDVSRTLKKMLEYMKTTKLKINIEENWMLMELQREPTGMDIDTLLFYSYLRLGRIENAIAVGQQIANEKQLFRILSQVLKEKRFEESVQLAQCIHEELKTNATKFNYAICLDKNGQLEECVNILEELDKKEIRKGRYAYESVEEMGILKLEKEITRDLVVGHLLALYWRMDNRKRVQEILEERKQFSIIPSDESLNSFIRIVTSHLMTSNSNYSLTKKHRSLIELNLNVGTKKIELSHCSLSLSSFDYLSPEELILKSVSFTRDGRKLKEVTFNEFLDFRKIKNLEINSDSDSMNMNIDLSEDVSMEYVELKGVRVLDWKEASWNVHKLKLWDTPFLEKTKMKVKKMIFWGSSFLDISCLPRTIQKVVLCKTEVFVSEGIDLPYFKHLEVSEMHISFFSPLNPVQLIRVDFKDMREVNVSLLPQSVKQIRITNCRNYNTRIVGGRRKLEKLILEISFEKLEECLSHFQTDNLVFHYHYVLNALAIGSKELLELMKKEIKTIAVGGIYWGRKEDFEIVSSHVDRKSNYYLLEGGRGKAIEEDDFWKLLNYVN